MPGLLHIFDCNHGAPVIATLLAISCSSPAEYADIRSPEDKTLVTEDTGSSLPAHHPFDADWLRRVSYDLRGIPPTVSELSQLKQRPESGPEIRQSMFKHERFSERMVHLLAERWHTRVDVFDIVVYDYGLDETLEYEFERAVGEEPLRIMSHIIANDLPWTETVLGDWTMATPLLASIWPITYPEGQRGWQVSKYNDTRPNVGVLSTNGLWWRYTTTDSNMNRRRAAAISRLLLCEDFLSRPVAFSEADTTISSTADAVQSDPYCLACHASLDPIAASLFGFWWLSLYSEIEETNYHPERESLWEQFLGVAPGWYGQPISGLPDLGVSIARDSRFYSCAVESFAETLWRRPTTAGDSETLEALRVQLLNTDNRIQPLLSSLTETEAYITGDVRMLTHDQFNSAIKTLTDFEWTFDGFDEIDSDRTGYRLLLGGVDGVANRRPQQTPSFTWALVIKRAAEAAAHHVVERELIQGEKSVFFNHITSVNDGPGTASFNAELRYLHRKLYSHQATNEWMDDIENLWTAVAADSNATEAWKATIAALLRDPAFLSY